MRRSKQPSRRALSGAPAAEKLYGTLAVAMVASLFVVRGAWLVARPHAGVEPHMAASVADDLPEGITAQDLATIAAVCPTALGAMPAEWRRTLEPRPSTPRAVDPTASAARITGLRFAARGEVGPFDGPIMGPAFAPDKANVARVAQALLGSGTSASGAPTADGWLVDPEAWYVPEDVTGVEPIAQEATDELPSDPQIAETPTTEPPKGTDPTAESPTTEPAAPVTTPADPQPGPQSEPPTTPELDRQPELRLEAPPEAPFEPALDDSQGRDDPRNAASEDLAPKVEGVQPETPSDPVVPWPSDADVARQEAERREAERQEAKRREGAEHATNPSGLPERRAPVAGDSKTGVPTPTRVAPPETAPPETAPKEERRLRKRPAAATEPKRPSPWRVPAPPEAPEPRAEPLRATPSTEVTPEAQAPDDSITRIETEKPGPVATPSAPVAKPRAPLFSPPPPTPRPLPPTGQPIGSPHGDRAKAVAEARAAAKGKSADESHAELFAKDCYPSAASCAECHKSIYDDWSISNHAYAFVSPMFHRFEEKITQLSNGTIGYFCYRCHSPVGTVMATELGYDRATPFGQLPLVAREGITCIACHRVNERFAKTNGERRIVPGDAYAPMYGGVGGSGVAEAIAKKAELKIKTSADEKGPGVPLHLEGAFFDQITVSEACTSCHQVAVQPGVKLEVVWEQYRASPACKKGVTCQECHMGRVPGMAGGYDYGAIAEVNGKTVGEPRKLHSHVFYGPGYSIAHPGVFPMHPKAERWKIDEWTEFDWRAGWGTDDFEDAVDDGKIAVAFPKVWAEADDRCDAREIIDDNLKKLARKRQFRETVMENGSKVDGPFFRDQPATGRDLRFDFVVTNLNEGHNLPTASLGAQPQLWANVVLVGPDGRPLWETGYTDSNGDLCDIHSVDVRKGRLPWDSQLFNLQTMFLITGATGTDREFYLPVNLDLDQVAQLRPGAIPVSVTNHPPFIRMESRSIAPLGKKRVKYRVPAELMTQPGRYRLSFRMRNRTEPMYFMRLCESTPEMHRAMVEGTLDIHLYAVEFDVWPCEPQGGAAALQSETYPR
ncbi:MAG: multiheme c-type cytochrome [Lacipirellulaceae bacterium]